MSEGRRPSLLLAALWVDLCALPLVALSASTLRTYGWTLFLGLPFALGFAMPFVLRRQGSRAWKDNVLALLLALAILAVGLLSFAIEGAICILMAAPVALVFAFVGLGIGDSICKARPASSAALLVTLALVLPVSMGVESTRSATPELWSVESAVTIDAPPDIVWRNVVAFGELPPPREWLFRAGVAYPLRAEIDGTGAGAVRRCVFTTGDFVEPITTWDEPRRLAFSVRSQPAPMIELSPWSGLHPPHLDGFLVSERGEFRLEALDGGSRTRLVGATWYRHRLAPASYWRLWSDAIIHRIHLRVLEQIRARSEAERARA